MNSVLDWIDADDAHRISGAENEIYSDYEQAYYCKNAPLEQLDELLLIQGITPGIYYGDEERAGLISFLSIYGSDAKLDINSADRRCFSLVETLSETEVDAILSHREQQPFLGMAELAQLVTVENYSQLQRYFSISAKCDYLSVAVSSWPTSQLPLLWRHTTYQTSGLLKKNL